IELNGAAVAMNLAAFRWGRALVAAPDAVAHATAPLPLPPPAHADEAAAIVAATGVSGELRPLLASRVADLIGYQDRAYAERYARRVTEVAELARTHAGAEAGERIAAAYARGAHKLLAYKDEYEVARLHLDAVERARLRSEMGANAKIRILL